MKRVAAVLLSAVVGLGAISPAGGWRMFILRWQLGMFSPVAAAAEELPEDVPPVDLPFEMPSETPSVEPSDELPDEGFETPSEEPSPEISAPVGIDWIGGVYTTPSPDDPEANRLIEVTLLPSDSSNYNNFGVVSVKNRVTDAIDVETVMNRALKFKKTKENEPQVLIIHTHGSESFLPDSRNYYVPSDIQRTEDTRFNVVRLGDEMAARLETMGINVIHDRTICDYPSYSGAYSKSLGLIEDYVKTYPSIQMVIDIHRDSLLSENGTAYKVVSETEKGKAAQMMFVIGSNLSGLPHPNWKDNLNVACRLQESITGVYGTLMRPITLRKERFNQHATVGSMILEVGTAWNTLDEALLAVNLFCDTAGETIKAMLGG